MRRTALLRRTPLKAKTPLRRVAFLTKSKVPLRKVSKKQAKENALWSKIKKERIEALVAKFGYPKCEWCKQGIILAHPDGHHNKGRVNTFENCRILHRHCHTYVTDNNIKDVPNLLEENNENTRC